MTGPSNGYAGTALAGRDIDPFEDMAAYDALPVLLRALVRGMPINIGAESIGAMVGRAGKARTVRALGVFRRTALAECRRLSEEACAL